MTQPISHFIAQIIKPAQSWHATLLSAWPTLMGTISSKAIIQQIDGNTVTLGVYDACWLQELYCMAPLICERFNKILDYPHVKEVRFKRIGITATKKVAAKMAPSPIKNQQKKPLNSYEQQALQKISDPDLQKALVAFRTRCHWSST